MVSVTASAEDTEEVMEEVTVVATGGIEEQSCGNDSGHNEGTKNISDIYVEKNRKPILQAKWTTN